MRAAVPFAAFFLSGASSLVFQTLWTRLLHHVFGSTSVAMSSVLTVFMAGLGAGAWLGGRYAHRLRRPLLVYALAEGGVALCVLLIPLLVEPEGWLADVNAALRDTLGQDSVGFVLLRFLCVIPILIVPTTLMGATLPLLARHFIAPRAEAASASARAGTLYAINTAGAVMGTFLGGFVLLPGAGLTAANYTAVGLNLFLAVTVGLLGRSARLGDGAVAAHETRATRRAAERAARKDAERAAASGVAVPSPTAPIETDPRDVPFLQTAAARRLVLLAFGVSGAAALCCEVVWSRALAMVLGSSIYSFTLILMTFLIGIAAGSGYLASCFIARPSRWIAPVAALALCFLAHARVGVAHSTFHFGVLVAACGAVILALEILLRGRLGPRGLTLAVLAVPLVSAVVQVFVGASDLPRIALTVVVAVSAFLLAPLWLLRRPMLLIGALQVFVAMATFLGYAWQDEIPATFARLVSSLDGLQDRVGAVQFFMFLTASLCTLPATLGMGAMFPLALRLFSRSSEQIGRDIGTVYTSNTLGSIVGAWLPGFVLLPLIGMERTLQLGIVLNLAVGALLVAAALWRAEGRTRRATVGALAALLAVPAGGAALYAATAEPTSALRWNQSKMTLGVFRVSRAKELAELPKDAEDPAIVYYRDGISTTVSVEEVGGYHSLKVNGKADASDVPGGDMYTQVALSAYPLLLHPQEPAALDVAVIGFGSGVTAGTALKLGARAVDVIELEPAVLEASRFFQKVNGLTYGPTAPFGSADRLRILMDDGRNYLASARRDYDLIISEPSNPWIAGVADLFTVEHFRISKRRLKKGGLYVQWVQLYEVSPENIKSIYRTFASQFAHVRVLASASYFDDTLLIGSEEPIPLDLARIGRRLGDPGVAKVLAQSDVVSPADLLARQLLGSRDEVLAYTQTEVKVEGKRRTVTLDGSNGDPPGPGVTRYPAPLNTDDNARIEFAAPRDLIGYERYAGYTSRLYDEEWPWGRFQEVPGLGTGDAAAAHLAELAMSFAGHLRIEEALRFLEQAQEHGAPPAVAVAALVIDLLTADEESDPSFSVTSSDGGVPLDEAQVAFFQKLLDDTDEAVRDGKGFAALAERAASHLKAGDPLNQAPLRFLHGFLLFNTAETDEPPYDAAVEALLKVTTEDAAYAHKQPAVYYFLARAYQRQENFTAAARYFRKYVEVASALGVLEAGAPDEAPDAAPGTEGDAAAPAPAEGAPTGGADDGPTHDGEAPPAEAAPAEEPPAEQAPSGGDASP